MLGGLHVNEVGHDHPAQVTQAQLPRNRTGGFQVGFVNRVFKIARTDKAAGVHIHRGQGLGLVNDQVTTRLEHHLAAQRLLNFFIDIEQIKYRPLTFVVREFGHCRRHELFTKLLQHRVLFLGINANGLGVFIDHVTQHPLQQVQVLVQQRLGRQLLGRGFHLGPGFAQIVDVFL